MNNNGNSFFIVVCLIRKGFIIAPNPIIKNTLTIQLPITLAKAIVSLLEAILLKEIPISGAEVPKATIVRAISILGTLHFIAKAEAQSTRTEVALIITIKPKIRKNNSKLFTPPLYLI